MSTHKLVWVLINMLSVKLSWCFKKIKQNTLMCYFVCVHMCVYAGCICKHLCQSAWRSDNHFVELILFLPLHVFWGSSQISRQPRSLSSALCWSFDVLFSLQFSPITAVHSGVLGSAVVPKGCTSCSNSPPSYLAFPRSSFPWVLFLPLLVCEGGEKKTESLELLKVVWQKPSALLTDSQTEWYLSAQVWPKLGTFTF